MIQRPAALVGLKFGRLVIVPQTDENFDNVRRPELSVDRLPTNSLDGVVVAQWENGLPSPHFVQDANACWLIAE